jgi:hypothetical protein
VPVQIALYHRLRRQEMRGLNEVSPGLEASRGSEDRGVRGRSTPDPWILNSPGGPPGLVTNM